MTGFSSHGELFPKQNPLSVKTA